MKSSFVSILNQSSSLRWLQVTAQNPIYTEANILTFANTRSNCFHGLTPEPWHCYLYIASIFSVGISKLLLSLCALLKIDSLRPETFIQHSCFKDAVLTLLSFVWLITRSYFQKEVNGVRLSISKKHLTLPDSLPCLPPPAQLIFWFVYRPWNIQQLPSIPLRWSQSCLTT